MDWESILDGISLNDIKRGVDVKKEREGFIILAKKGGNIIKQIQQLKCETKVINQLMN